MTILEITHAQAAPRIGFGRILNTIKAYRDQRRTELALRHLDAHLRRDVGLPPREQDPVTDLMRKASVQW